MSVYLPKDSYNSNHLHCNYLKREEVLAGLNLIKDEPDLNSELFSFNKFATQLKNILLDASTPTPYMIGLHGEWGSGKTSLIYRSYELTKNNLPNNTWKTIWFDAWEYE
jgi:predicted KAP-like P-loop ATPase